MDEASTGHTVQNGRIIELTNAAQPMFFSEKVGRDYGSPAGGWTEHRSEATRMPEQRAQHLLDGALANVAPYCRVVTP